MSNISLKSIFLFDHLTDEKVAEVEELLIRRQYEAGEVLFNMGDPGDELFIVETGQIAIYAPSEDHPGSERPIRIFSPGGMLGEMALIDDQPRSLSARALEPSQVLVLRDNDFHRLLREDPELAIAIMVGLSDRIRYTTEFLNEVRTWVGRIATGDYESGDFLSQMRDWMHHVAEGDYEHTVEEADRSAHFKDQTIATLAAEFAKMAVEVQKREEALRREIAQLKVEIDEAKRQADVSAITGSDYFQKLKAEAQALRDNKDD